MISVEEAQAKILSSLHPLPPEMVPLRQSRGRVLAEPVTAPRDLPPWPNAAMDGYAFRFEDLSGWPPRLRVLGVLGAGREGPGSIGAGEAVKIMTGAPMPAGADTVVPVEDTTAAAGEVALVRPPARHAHVRPAAEDVARGEVVLPAGTILRPAEIALLAGLGRTSVTAHRRPKVALLATGDEIVDLGAPSGPDKLFDANSYGLAAQTEEAGALATLLGVARDDPAALREKLEASAGADVLVTSGGISQGDYDHLPEALEGWGVTLHFRKVAIKPGKPMLYGRKGMLSVFGLPGNPVAAMLGFEAFVRPALLRLQGVRALFRPLVDAVLTEAAGEIRGKGGRPEFLRCRVAPVDGMLAVVAVHKPGSGLLHTLARGNGFLVVPADRPEARPGDVVSVQLYDLGCLDRTEARSASLQGSPGRSSPPPRSQSAPAG